QAAAGAEGQMLLSWYAPDSNGNVFVASTAVAGYAIRIATYSVASVGGSTQSWWNGAMDVAALPAPAVPVAPPAPASPGTTQFLLINQLWPGATYFAMIVSSDSAGLSSGADANAYGVQASTLVYDAAPPSPTGLAVTQVAPGKVTVTWNAVAAYDLDAYRVYFDSTPPYDFASSSVAALSSGTLADTITGLSSGTYAFKVTAVDRGAPAWPGVALESLNPSSTTVTLVPAVHRPQAPFGVALTTGAATAVLRWMPVARFADFAPFAVSTAPTADEVSGYHVYRATSPTRGGWTDMAVLSTATLSWTDLASGPQYYYHVRSENSSGLSERSAVRAAGDLTAYSVAPDDMSYWQILGADVGAIEGAGGDPMTAYLIVPSSRPMDLGALQGRVMKSVVYDAYLGGVSFTPNFATRAPGVLRLRYELASSTGVTPSARVGGVPATPGNLSIYWYNGARWVQLYGSVDQSNQMMTISTKFSGQYQLRVVERATAFSFDASGVSNRFVTPNGDGRNDNVVFTFDDPADAAVTGKILDLRGRVVVSSLPPGPVTHSLMWDGTAGGRPVPGGVYVYQIVSEGRTYSGTVVVIR
ncbi:MAG: hypothetical protein HY079_12580, partial [Elusimicrobia bacterium]|nr:hypothetical protein [Elusimicrobiota bacterium]